MRRAVFYLRVSTDPAREAEAPIVHLHCCILWDRRSLPAFLIETSPRSG
jgi:hypothetical protein